MRDCPWPGVLLLLGWVFVSFLHLFFFFFFFTFDGTRKVCLSGIKVLAKERAIFFTLAYPLRENCDVTFHHLNWTPMLQVHSVRKDKKASVLLVSMDHLE